MNSNLCESAPGTSSVEKACDRVHVWKVCLNKVVDDSLLKSYVGILSAGELAKQQRFVFAKDKHRYLVTRALVRIALSRFAEIDPAEWCFIDNGYGRPMLHPCHVGVRSLSFSVSHSGEWVVMALGQDIEIGIDIEDLRANAPLQLAESYFAKTEALELRRLQTEERHFRFFELWTLKESYTKARGLGLSIPLQSISFDLRKPGDVAFDCELACDRNPKDWCFLVSPVDKDHVVSLCFRANPARDVDIVWHYSIPLQGEFRVNPPILRRTPQKTGAMVRSKPLM
jgi:4'-phosphopantetheinyl transferase